VTGIGASGLPPQERTGPSRTARRRAQPAAQGDPPIGAVEAESLLKVLAPHRHVLLAVSGGPDSMALLLLAARHAGAAVKLSVATVDHGLRAEAVLEADAVARLSRSLGLDHRVLRWDGPKPTARIQEKAREARYALLAAHAAAIGATAVATAHHADDQAETVLLRMVRGSGPAGLAAMRPDAPLAAVRLLRPLLDVGKVRLVATIRAAGLPFADDPSNADPRFARARLRALEAALAREGLTRKRLTTLARRAARAEDALQAAAAAARDRHTGPTSTGGAEHDLSAAMWREPEEIRLRLLWQAVEAVAGASPRLERIEAAAERLAVAAADGTPATATIGGCLLRLDRLGKVTITREKVRRRGASRD
jgi:tRNA(Ile)-lysidine synthase